MKSVMAAATAALLAACSGETSAPTAQTPSAGETPAAAAPAPSAAASLTGPAAGKWRSTTTAGGMTMPAMEICYDK